MSRLSDYYEQQAEELRRSARGDIATERARVASAEAARRADAERVQALLDSRPDWQQRAGVVDVVAIRQTEHEAWVKAAAQARRTSRTTRWRQYVGEHPNSVDAWGQPKNYTEDDIPEWFQ